VVNIWKAPSPDGFLLNVDTDAMMAFGILIIKDDVDVNREEEKREAIYLSKRNKSRNEICGVWISQ
jgi:hypothetical protein